MYTFIKFGGSVITDKAAEEQADLPMIAQLATELRAACVARPDLRIVLGHGSGSFGHPYAARYGIHRGLAASDDWLGFALTADAALRLNRIVVDALLTAGVSALALQPSATLHSEHGQVTHWDTRALGYALEHGLVPVIHGDVAFDTAQGSAIISTEALLIHLAQHTTLQPTQIVLVGEAAVYSADPHTQLDAKRIPLITAANIDKVLHGATGSHAVDVTGGMHSKIALMWQLVQAVPGLEVRLIGTDPGLLAAVLRGDIVDAGTTVKG